MRDFYLMTVRFQKLSAVVLLLFSFLFTSFFVFSNTPTVSAASTDVVINEIMYHPSSDDNDDEFLELYNTAASPIDLDGWCFTDGIDLCFTAGQTIVANGYLIVSPNNAQTTTTYGVTPPYGEYAGKLSNGGETITLEDSDNNIASTLTYGDNSPWPNSPDGTGPSLELIDSALTIDDSTNWAASLNSGGTPNVVNSVTALTLPNISNVTDLTFVDANTVTNITASVDDATTVELKYIVMFETEQTLTMYDDGAHNDGASSDKVFGATIPAQTAGSLIRFKIEATNIDGTKTSPSNDDSTNYHPFIVDDGQTSDIPIVRWFMDTDDYEDMTTNHLTDDQQFPAVVAVGDQLFDNALVRVKGQVTVNFPKKKFKFDLPSGYTVQPEGFDYPVDEFALNAFFLNLTDLQESLGWRAFSEAGFNKLQNVHIRVQRNTSADVGAFQGHYLLLESYDKAWRERNDYQTGALYKQMDNKKTRLDEDDSDIQSLYDNLTTLQGEELKQYLLDNLNIPAIVNYHAVSAATFHDDWSLIKNIYEYRDTEGTGRWEYLPWDLDNVFLPSLFKEINSSDYLKHPISMLANPAKGEDSWYYQWAIIERAMYQFPEFREMFFRRSMVLYDQIWQSGEYLQWHDEYYLASQQTIAEDYDIWNPFRQSTFEAYFPNGYPYTFVDDFPFDVNEDNIFESTALQSPEIMRTIFVFAADRLKNDVTQARANGELLSSQTSQQEQNVKINEIQYSPSMGSSFGYIELYNGADVPIDISSWTLGGVGFTFPSGAVLPAKSYAVIVKNDKLFRSQNPSALVLGEYSGTLSNEGELLTLKSGNNIISSVNYDVKSPWPNMSSYPGKTLSLINVSVDESNPACWAPSSTSGGSPYNKNTTLTGYDTLNCYKTVGADADNPHSIFSKLLLPGSSIVVNTEPDKPEDQQKNPEASEDSNVNTNTHNAEKISNNTDQSTSIAKVVLIGGLTFVVIGFAGGKAYAIISLRKAKITK